MSRAICIPFRMDRTGNVMWTTNENRIWDDRVISVLGTVNGTRVQRPGFGLTTRNSVLFDGRDEAHEALVAAIGEAFALHLPDLQFISASAEYNPASGEDVVTVVYLLPNRNLAESQLALNLTNEIEE